LFFWSSLFLLVFFVVLLAGLFFRLLVPVLKITAGCSGGRPDDGSNSGVTRNGADGGPGAGADGRTTQGALFGIRHARATTQCQADYQYNCNSDLFHD
jgi:hypothetical protein